ncbi:MAG: hypothetical protein WKG07_02575 [Hymenobacter sp.]
MGLSSGLSELLTRRARCLPRPTSAAAPARRACAPVVSNVVVITVTPAVTAGSIGSDQTICPGATPTSLTSTAGPGGGTGTFAYQWQSSANNANWNDIAGATDAGYAPGPLIGTTYYPAAGNRRALRAGVLELRDHYRNAGC